MRILIFEDEIPAYEKLVNFITSEIASAEILGWARSLEEGKKLLNEFSEIDLIFSDIELLDGISLSLFHDVELKCPVVFCTAFDQYLFDAFQTNGIAYLLKPYDLNNFQEAIKKYRSLFGDQAPTGISKEVLTQLKSLLKGERNRFKSRFSIKKKTGIKLLSVEDIVAFQANGDFSFAHDRYGLKHMVNYPVGEIESQLDPNLFFRINRSEIVNIDYIDSIQPHFKNRLVIVLEHLDDKLSTSTSKTPAFRNWLEK